MTAPTYPDPMIKEVDKAFLEIDLAIFRARNVLYAFDSRHSVVLRLDRSLGYLTPVVESLRLEFARSFHEAI